MEILNTLHGDTAMILPQKVYIAITGEFASHDNFGFDHQKYLGDPTLRWDLVFALQTAKFVHFSD